MPPKKRSKKAAAASKKAAASAAASASVASSAASGGRRPTRRAAAASASASAAASSSTRTSKESSAGTDISKLALADLLRHLQSASATKARCTAALQALIDGHCPRPSISSAMDIETAAKAAVEAVEAKEKSSADTAASAASDSTSDEQEEDIDAAEQASQDASLVPLTTHVLQRLLTQLRDHASASASAVASTSTSAKGAGKKKKKSKSTGSSAAAAAAASSNVNEEEVGEEANQVQVQVAVVAIALSYSLTQLLLTDRPRLEKCAHHTTPPASASASASSKGSGAEDTTGSDARSIVGRAIVAASLSSLAGLEVLVKYGLVGLTVPEEDEDEDNEDPGQTQEQSAHIALLRSSAWSALRTMERLTHINLNPPSVSPSGSGIQHSQVGYASPSAHYHASVASSNTVNAWKEVLKELCRGTELRLAIVGTEPGDEDDVDDDGADDKMEVEEEEGQESDGGNSISNVSNGTALLVDKVCGIASGATSEKFPGEMEVLYAALNRVSIDPSAAVAAAPSGSKSKSSSKRPTRKTGKKRGASSQSSGGGASTAAATSLLSILHHSHMIVFDGRIAIRRWTPMSLVWFGVGQKTVLDLATAMLRSEVDDDESDGSESDNVASWSTVLAPLGPGILECSDDDGATSVKSNKRKRRSLSPNRISEDDSSDGDSPPRKISKSATGGKKRAAISPAKTKKGTGGGRKSPANADGDRLEDGEDSSRVTVPGNIALIAFASRLVDLANEIGLTCGAKAPTGGMEAYARGILEVTTGNGQSSKGGSSRPKQKKKKSSKKASSSASTLTSKAIRLPGGGPSADETWVRPDIRHEAAALTRWILSAHSQSLLENFDEDALLSTGKRSHAENGVSGSRGQYLVNDDVLSTSKQLRETALCFPFMPRTLDALARCASSTIPLSSTSSSHGPSDIPRDSVSTCIGKMMALASALAIGGGSIISIEDDEDAKVDGEGHFVIADARLSSMAVCTLMDCIKRIAAAPNTGGGASSSTSGGNTTSSVSIPGDLVQQYHLDQPLMPSLEEDVAESAKVDNFCSYGGTFILLPPAGPSSSASTGGDDDLGVLLGMASSSTGHWAGGSLDDADVLALFLRAMLAPSDDYQYSVEDCTSRLLTQILRIIGCCYTRVPDVVPCVQGSNVEAMGKMAFAKSALATDALEALRKALLIRLTSSSSSSSKDRLRCCLRSCGLRSDHIRCLVDSSFFLEKFFHDRVYSARQANFEKSEEDETNEGNGATDEVFDVSTRHGKAENQYDQAERRLWQSHIKCCLTVGRGKPGDLYVASNMGFCSEPILGDCKTRLSVYQSVVDSFVQSNDLKLSWPLALPSTLHALVTSNLSVEPLPKTVKDAAPERRICDRFVEAISEALQDLALVSNCTADFYVPLSLDDSRMFLLALLRIPKKEQTKVMAKLVDNIHDGVVQGSFDFGAFKSAEERAAASGFLARLITVAVAAADSIRAGRHLLETLRMQTGSEHYHIPAGLYDNFTHKEDWYGRSKSFLSLYGDWEQSGVPVPDVIDGTEPMVKASINKLITSFMVLFDKSFLSAKDDHCQLLFSAWNALSECSVWDLKAPMSLESLASGDTAPYARSLIEMRQDMCAIYKRIIGSSESHPDTMLFRGLTKKADTSKFRAMTVSTMLKTAVQFAVDITDKAVATLMKDDCPSSSSSSAALCAYESVAAYISFLIAMHTKPEKTVNSYFGDDKLQKAGRRKGSGMSDSIEDAGSSDESDYDEDEEDEAKMVVLSKLNEACQAIGAAPVHPDWLDHSVRIRPGISPSEAAEAAKTALASLSKLAHAARIHQEKALRQSLALSSTNRRPDAKDAQNDAALALRIQRSVQDEDSSRSSAIAETLGLPSLNDLSCSSSNDATVRETWCTNSAQQIRGGFQECAATLEGWSTTSAELRATNEWEMLLGDSLVTACTNIAASKPDELAKWGSDSEALGAALDDAERWQNIVRSCAEAMVPCAALLRQGLNCGRGRSPHPLSARDQASKLKSHEPNVLRPSSPLPDSNIVSFVSVPQDGIKSALATSIAVLSDVASESGKTHALTKKACHAALCHLLGDSSQQKKIEDLAGIRTNFSALYAFDRALSSIGGAGDERVPIRPDEIVIGIVNGLDREEIVSQLLSALGIDNALKIDVLSERQVNPAELLRDAQKQLIALSPASSSSGDDESLLPWTWGEKQEKPIHLLMEFLFKKTHNLTSATRSSIARLLGNLLVAEANHLLNTTSAGGNKAVILPIIAKAWNQLDKKEVERVVRDDICCTQNEEDSGCISLCKNVCTLLTQLCCSDTSTSTNMGAGEDSYLVAAQIMASSIKDWTVVPDGLPLEKVSILEYQMELLCTLSTRSYGEEHDQLLKKTGEELLTLVAGERPGLKTKRGKAKAGLLSADARYLQSLEFFFYYVHALNKRMNQMDVDIDPPTAESQKQQKASAKGASSPLDPDHPSSGNDDEKDEFFTTKAGTKVRRTCTFIDTGGDFKEQHWYNCYTCGLLWDKGCCTLCALTCHRDHDVGYSRKSSFFCDCGAEVASAGEENRVACQCLSPLSSKELATIYEEPESATKKSEDQLADSDKQIESSSSTAATKEAMNHMASHSHKRAKRTINALVRSHPDRVEAAVKSVMNEVKSSWGECLVEVFDGCFQAWSKKVENPDTLSGDLGSPLSSALVGSGKNDPACAANATRETGVSDRFPDISSRSGVALSLSKIQGNAMIPVRAAKANSVTVKLSSDPSTDRIKKALLSKNSIKRSALVSDSRGRVVVAEPNSLFFCSALPLVNVRYPAGPAPSSRPPIDRNQLCCLGSHKVDFSIVGMQFCPENDRHLVIWGTAEASIIVLSKNCDRVEKKIDLAIELEPHECDSEYLLKCDWLPSSETHVAVICGTFVKVFDARRSTTSSASASASASASGSGSTSAATAPDRCKQYTCSSTTCYTLAYEDALIRSAAVVPLEKAPSLNSSEEDKTDHDASSCAKIFLLFDSGRIHGIDIAFDSNSDLDDQGEIYIEAIGGLSFPTAGVRRYSGAVPGSADSKSTSFGEGSSLVYLQQSGLLLYKCISSCVVAFVIDRQSGDISGSFEFLPQVITSSMLGSGLDGYSISAPYAQWTELGTCEKDGGVHYRIACTGKSTRTNQPKLLLVEFSVDSVRVQELSWTGGSTLGLGLSLNTCFEGIAAFSAPVIRDASNSNSFYERAYLAALTSNGSILVYGEDLTTQGGEDPFRQNHTEVFNIASNHSGVATHISSSSIGDNNVGQPKFPLTIFETLENFSHSQELVLGGDGVGKDPDTVKKKLSIHNGDFFLSPSRDGCTLTVALQQSKSIKPSSLPTAENFRAIVAVRLLLGSTTTDYLPRQVSVMGRIIKLSQGVKRWYDLPLTNEEIMLGIRSGFVALSISSSFDPSNNPLIDALEVYALPVEDLPFAVPPSSSCKDVLSNTEGGPAARETDHSDQNESALKPTCILERNGDEKAKLQLILLSTVRAAQIALGDSSYVDANSFIDRKFILRSIEVTALETQAKDQSVRQNVMDLVQKSNDNVKGRDFLVDGGTLSGIRKVMATLLVHVERFCSEASTDQNMTTDDDAMEVDTDSETLKSANALSYLPSILSTLNDCLSTALDIVRARPAHYSKSLWENTEDKNVRVSEDEKQQTLALIAGKILTPALSLPGATLCSGFALACANFVELAIREIGTEWASFVESPTFDLVAKFLKCTDKDAVRMMTHRMVEMSQSAPEDENADSSGSAGAGKSQPEADKPPIAYQCDGCETFPIQRVRYTLEGGHDIDLCQDCYDVGVQYARSSAPDVAAYINGKSFDLNTGESMTCTDLLSMKRVMVGDEVLEDVRMSEQASDNDEDADLQLALAMSMSMEASQKAKKSSDTAQKVIMDGNSDAGIGDEPVDPNRFISPLFDGVLDLVSASITGGSKANAKHVDLHLDCLLQLVKSSDPEEIQVERGKKMADILCGAIVSIATKLKSSHGDSNEEVVPIDDEEEMSEDISSSYNLVLFVLSSLVNGRNTVAASREACSSEVLAATIVTTHAQDSASGKAKGNVGHKDKTDPRFVCDTHGVPAVRRRCSRGVHKDRRFYVCGMERKSRCKYFRWADEATDERSQRNETVKDVVASQSPVQNAAEPPSPALKAIQEHVWSLLTATNVKSDDICDDPEQIVGNPLSMYAQMCKQVNDSFKRMQPSGSQIPDVSFSTTITSADASAFKMDSLVDKKSMQEDLCDGVNLSRAKLRRPKQADDGERTTVKDTSSDSSSRDACNIYASLDLLGSVASPTKHGDSGARGSWIPLLCEIIGTGQHSSVRGQAKRLLKRLCGGKSNYHRVRDHYIFSFQYKALLGHCVTVLEAALIARERARQCGQNWREDTLTWSNMSAGSLIGACDLVSEDAFPVKCMQNVNKAFDELIDLTKHRSNNWRHFCALSKLPQNGSQTEGGTLAVLSETSPIISLFWIASSLSKHCDKALRLIEIALTARPQPGTEHLSAGVMSTDGGTDFNTDTNDLSPGKRDLDTPEQALFSGDYKGLKSDEVYAFVMQFVLRGRTTKVRSFAKRIGHALSHVLTKTESESMFAKFVTNSLREVQTFGESSVEFLEFLQALATCRHNSSPSSNISEIAQLAVSCFTRQLSSTIQVLRSDDAAVEVELKAGSGQYMKKNFDLSSCAHCHREQVSALRVTSATNVSDDSGQGPPASSSGQSTNRSSSNSRRHVAGSSDTGSSSRDEVPTSDWLDDQVRPYTKDSLESSTESSISAEFTSYVKLKCRMAISEVHLSASDPRGRFVKTVAVYFTPRHVGKVEDLKKDDYLPIWQHCGNLNLSRGATRASFKLNTPVIAANLKFEYAEFHEKANSGRSADGGLILHCPRCTRVVNNAHGVCGHCGEVAFQCRKCRHINYDKLDAFLCVECGYCAYASFNYDLTAGIASNAVAITNEEDYERGVRLLRAAAKRQSDLRDHKLRKKLLVAAPARKKRAREADFDDLGWLSSHSPHMKRAMLGELPRMSSSGKSDGSHHVTDSTSSRRKSSGHGISGGGAAGGSAADRSSAASRARSLLSLARQLRDEASGRIGGGGDDADGERLSRGDMLVRQALLGGSAGSFEMGDEDADMLGLLGAASSEGGGLGFEDPLSRLVADIQGRVREGDGTGDHPTGADYLGVGGSGSRRRGRGTSGESDGGAAGGGGGDDGNASSDAKSSGRDNIDPRQTMEELDTLHQQMREAERECFELRTKLNAWTRLNCDRIADTGSRSRDLIFTPTTCGLCCSKVTLSMLLLVVSLLQHAEEAITPDFVRILFEDSLGGPDHDDLVRYQRWAIVKIALLSERGADMVLNELRLRLKASQDTNSAQILGSILSKDGVKGAERFVELAEAVLSGQL